MAAVKAIVLGFGGVKLEDIAAMAIGAVVLVLANPGPEVDPDTARRHAAVVATGRNDQPDPINNVLVFPGAFPRSAGRRGDETDDCRPARRPPTPLPT
ncbi:hypothetical protein [Actinoallomurus acaciae]|uniref:Uncharacterized protein n=1 Tax=Actinoallomurus acaciae TaxID=502577 RepID=A0ABV5Y7R5_9ACTN